MELLHKNIMVFGKVQGVGFRYSCMQSARSFGIKGYVKNLSDGSVYIEAEGNSNQLSYFIKWCHRGSPHSRVSDINIENGNIRNYEYFDLKH